MEINKETMETLLLFPHCRPFNIITRTAVAIFQVPRPHPPPRQPTLHQAQSLAQWPCHKPTINIINNTTSSSILRTIPMPCTTILPREVLRCHRSHPLPLPQSTANTTTRNSFTPFARLCTAAPTVRVLTSTTTSAPSSITTTA